VTGGVPTGTEGSRRRTTGDEPCIVIHMTATIVPTAANAEAAAAVPPRVPKRRDISTAGLID
jgi:hypothetical protein